MREIQARVEVPLVVNRSNAGQLSIKPAAAVNAA